jgi:hypothetical protein
MRAWVGLVLALASERASCSTVGPYGGTEFSKLKAAQRRSRPPRKGQRVWRCCCSLSWPVLACPVASSASASSFSPRRRLPRVESGSGLAGQRRQPNLLVAMGARFMELCWLDKYAVRSGYLLVAQRRSTCLPTSKPAAGHGASLVLGRKSHAGRMCLDETGHFDSSCGQTRAVPFVCTITMIASSFCRSGLGTCM